MAGIYLHIPFCKQACHYCDFHFSTSMGLKEQVLQAMHHELELQKSYLNGEVINTIYFGGGTPSILSVTELNGLLEAIYAKHTVNPAAEITLEANPDDLTPEKLQALRQTRINRLSIGVQSFHDPHLQLMNRPHTAVEAVDCIRMAQELGFDNISLDLIYGIPAEDATLWEEDLTKAFALNVQHLSCYALTIEPNTVFGNRVRKGTFSPADEERVARQFEVLMTQAKAHGFLHYEISNFCQPGFESKHNSSYWKQVPYLGLGPSAHSFNGVSRQFNIAHNPKYVQALEAGQLPCTVEELSIEDRVNEYVMTTLRTSWGCDTAYIQEKWGIDLVALHAPYLQKIETQGLLRKDQHVLVLTEAGKLLADEIALDLFLLKEEA
ncbi:radical SAM family heme chaperone HemW [Rufibacter latericius]|uniref:Heme chaperone HemW n=1 Tax=Rufibacter latericius TaxID=2487040 RepID=A0A3M9MG07_9BACT|nr:radical SAM family heme chaperone HemW [Rufibacter latericius]RNI23568.1 radical SAM family heme chaperone HemW [Rufibacter latericius]